MEQRVIRSCVYVFSELGKDLCIFFMEMPSISHIATQVPKDNTPTG